MSNRIIAVDMGAWSVKVAIAQPGLRGATLTGFVERLVPEPSAAADDQAWEVRAARVLAQIAREQHLEHDNVFVLVPGDNVFTHVLEFGFKNLRRQDLEKAVGAELEAVVPVELEDMVYAFEPIPANTAIPLAAVAGGPDPAPVPGRVAPPTTGMRVLTYAMPRPRAEAWLKLVSDAGAPARSLIPDAGPIARLVERVPGLAGARAAGPVAVIDVGHLRTEMIVVHHGKPVYARTIARGGKHLTDAIAKHWKLPWAEAEKAKHTDGYVASTVAPATSESWARVSEVTTTELAPLARELRQSVAACRAKTGAVIGAALLVGGGSRLRGLDNYLAEQLGLNVQTLTTGDAQALIGPKLADQVPADVAALDLGVIADAATGRPLFDLRSGALAAKVDLSFLRAKAGKLAFAAIMVALFATASGFAAHYKIRKDERILTRRLAIESTEEFGDPQTAKQVLAGATGVTAEALTPLPKLTAWDILLDINSRMPARDKITLDIDSIDIDVSKVIMKGTAATPEEVDALEQALKGQACFQEVTRGAMQQTADGKRQFDFTIKAACM